MDIFGTVTSAVSIVELLYRTSKDLRDRLENVSQNPRLVRELIDALERLSSRLEPIVTTCKNNHVQFSADYLQTFEGCIKRLQGLFKDAQSELECMREKLNSPMFGFRKAKTTSKRLSQLLASIEKAEQEIVTISAGCVAWFEDGKRVASGSYDETVKVWEVETGEPVGEPFRGHSSYITFVAWSFDGKRVTAGSFDETMRVWEVESGACLNVYEDGWERDKSLRSFACRELADKARAGARQSLVSDSFPKVDLLNGTQLCFAQRYGDNQERVVLATFEGVVRLHRSAVSPRFFWNTG